LHEEQLENGMQSASVILETSTVAGQRQTHGSEEATGNSGLFGQELRQRQQQFETQRSVDSQPSSRADMRADKPSHDSQNRDVAHSREDDADSERRTANGKSAAESGEVEQNSVVDRDDEEDGDDEKEESVSSEPGLFSQSTPQDGVDPEKSGHRVNAESGNNLPPSSQSGGSTDDLTVRQLAAESATADISNNLAEEPFAQGAQTSELNSVSGGDQGTESGIIAGAVTNANQGDATRVAPQAVASAASPSSSNPSFGQGGGNSGNPDSMTGRQQLNGGDMAPPTGDVNGSSDKTASFLASLKSVVSEGEKGVDMPAVAPAGGKAQAQQLSQMVSQLSSIQGGSQVQTTTPIASANATSTEMNIATSMRQQGWDRAMGERLVFMARNGIQEAQLQVNPRNLGPIEIKVSVNQEQQANVSFVTTNTAARETIDAAMPRLREMFDQAGLDLAESEVFQRDQQQGAKEGAADDNAGSNRLMANSLEGEEEEDRLQHIDYIRPAGLDLFA